ncbi:glycogenin-1 isoform X3 [Drosophila sulfurigaster albostrigata]|uniref:glycogenin-1 isoform X3 n=1 Tax=Drosophila sulfurigaster albostrigata TaxID=89887 RepID=UPI002D21AC92|nr:glycogenin-1 isoform X3 [Drosophila sulfurigaster albostrigata]
MSKFAWVTLTTNDTYSLGALVLAHSLKRAGTAHQLAVLVTPTVSEAMRDRLKDVYNVVQEVNVLDSQDAANLALLSRPELGVTFTKLHCWRLVQFEKCVFLDADTLVLKNCDELFEREELSAAPDVSWPDCFNSGVFVFTPSVETFNKITEYAVQHGSFDGGDQGLLNQYFADWSTADIKKHLPFVYNVTAYASYCYLPAFKQFRDKIKILHFAGKLKPWLLQFNSETKTVSTPTDYAHAQDLIQHWWNIFCDSVHDSLSDQMCLCLNIIHSTSYNEYHYDMDSYYYEHCNNHYHREQQPHEQQPIQQYVPDVREYRDPWADYYEQAERQEENESQTEFRHNEYASGHHQQQQQHEECRPTSPQAPPPQEPPQAPPQAPSPQLPSTANEDSIAIDVNSNVHATEQSPTNNSNNNNTSHAHSEHHQNYQNHQEHHHPENATQNPSDHSQVDEVADDADEAGLAGALSQLRIGAQRTPEQEQYENLMRRQCWESGQIDYSGADSFDNIWKKITQTLEAKPETSSEADQTVVYF